ncbi:MAG: RNA pyrophosphohydrolase [bacterium]|nr:RNA pyrophosphohydrolase [bacterium]
MSLTPPKSAVAYRKCVGIMVLNAENKIFVGKRIDVSTNAWQMPQGGIDEGESPLEAACRELKEETGIHNATLIAELGDWLTYDLPEPLRKKLWSGKYQGQSQKWFAFRFSGKESEINLDTETPEFTHWKWVDTEELLDNVIDFKRETYRTLVKTLIPMSSPKP